MVIYVLKINIFDPNSASYLFYFVAWLTAQYTIFNIFLIHHYCRKIKKLIFPD